MSERHRCRWCRGTDGEIVLDLGHQPAAGHFPAVDDPGPDPAYPLQMWCAGCGLAQLLVDPTVPEEPRGAEPAALVEQAAATVERVAAAGRLRAGNRAVEYGSPHGGSWLGLLAERALTPVGEDEQGDVVLDCFGLTDSADQAARARRAGVPGRTGRGAAAVPFAGHDRPARPVELAASRPLGLLLDGGAARMLPGGGLRPTPGVVLRPLRRDGAARRHPPRRRDP